MSFLKQKIIGIPIWIFVIAAFFPLSYFGGQSLVGKIINGSGVSGLSAPLATSSGAYDANIDVSGVFTNGSVDRSDPKNIIITVPGSTTLSTTGNTHLQFTLDTTRTDTNQDLNSAYPKFKIIPRDLVSFSGKTTTGTTYYSVIRDSDSNYNVSIAALSAANSKDGYSYALQTGTANNADIIVTLDDYTTYKNEFINTSYASKKVASFDVVAPNGAGEVIGTVTLMVNQGA